MTLTRYQIRNEYGLADKELYQAVDKEDPEALLESTSMAGLVGVLRQLGDLAEFAAEVFHCLQEELVSMAARGNGLTMRLQKLEAEFPSIEIPILAQTDHSTFFYDPGLEWQSNQQTKQNLITPRNLPRCIIDSYEECRGPPQLFHLDKFDVAGSGACLKRYSDPSLLKTRTASTVVATSKLAKDERLRKPKKKASEKIGEESHEASRKSHSKLHQLFLLEHVENGEINPEFHVKLKRRQLNGLSINSSSGTSYMEKFLKSSSLYCERVHGSLDQSPPAMETEVTVYSVGEDTREHNEIEMECIADDDEILEVSFVPQEITSKEKPLPNIEEGPVICLERSSSVNNDRDETVSMKSETKEADSDDKVDSNLRFPGFGFTNEGETQTEVLTPFSNVFPQTLEEEDEEATQRSSSCSENPPNLLEDSGSRLELQSNEIELKSSEACEKVELERDSIVTQAPQDVSECGTEVLLTNYVEDHQSQHGLNVETESEISLTGLVEDHQFASITSQKIEALEPEEISSEAPVALESDFLLPNQYIIPSYTFEDSSLASDDAQDNLVPEEDETNSLDESSTHAEKSENTSTFEICSENGTLISDTPKDLSASCRQEDSLEKPDTAAISSCSGEEDTKAVSIVADEPEVPIPDTHFSENQCLNDIASETKLEKDLDNISYLPQESLLDTQAYFSSGYCIETQDQEQETPSETDLADPITESAESLPHQVSTQESISSGYCIETQDKEQESPSETESADPISERTESLPYTQDCLSSEYCIEIQDKEQETPSESGSEDPIKESAESLSYGFSTPSMDLTDQENRVDVDVSEPTVPFSISFHETAQTDPEIMPPLPPLPPTQWLMGKIAESVKTTKTQFTSLPSFAGNGYNNLDENIANGSVQATKSQPSSENHNVHVYTEENSVEEDDISTGTESTLKETLKKTMEESFVSSVSQLRAEIEEESDWRSEAMALEWFSQNLREQSNPTKPLQETESPKTLRDNNSYDENPNIGMHPGIDRSMLRKVSERNRTEVEARVEESDSLLQIIRNKSFNLRPADASVRPNFKVAAPITNFKVAAMLEKANTLRQAMAGSDDEHDSDSWSE